MPWVPVIPCVDPSVRALCRTPYPGHKTGCPNFGDTKGHPMCPPKAPMIGKVLDLSQPVIAVYNAFDFGSYIEMMRKKHPSWTERQLACCLYWQPKQRRILKQEVRRFLKETPGMHVCGTPEACGVNLTETMRSAGIELEWPPRTVAYQIVLAEQRAPDAVNAELRK